MLIYVVLFDYYSFPRLIGSISRTHCHRHGSATRMSSEMTGTDKFESVLANKSRYTTHSGFRTSELYHIINTINYS